MLDNCWNICIFFLFDHHRIQLQLQWPLLKLSLHIERIMLCLPHDNRDSHFPVIFLQLFLFLHFSKYCLNCSHHDLNHKSALRISHAFVCCIVYIHSMHIHARTHGRDFRKGEKRERYGKKNLDLQISPKWILKSKKDFFLVREIVQEKSNKSNEMQIKPPSNKLINSTKK